MAELVLVEPQKIMIEHMQQTKDALLFCGMGLSKTAAVLSHLNELFLSGEARAALVVGPMRVANLTWPSEVRDWDQFRWMRVANLRTESGQREFLRGRAHLYLVNYESLHHLVSLVERRGGSLPYDVAVYDELTRARNPGSKRINLYRRKVPRVERNIGLTGTPIPNSWIDLFAQVRLVDDGLRLGTNFSKFKAEFFMQPAYAFAPWKEKKGTPEKLEQAISDITITLKSSDWLNIPDTVYEDVEIKFTPELQEKYEKLEEELVIELQQGKTLNVANAAALVTKLLQFTSGHIYDEEKVVHPVHNLKFEALARIAKHEKQPLFVACIFQHEQARIRAQFPQARFFADAKTPDAQKKLLDEWNAGKIPMLVSHPASVGHGLNLQHGSSVIVWMSLTYSRENYEQMIARLARRGQQNIIRVYRLMVPGTVDDAVAEALANKASNEARLISALQMLESYRKYPTQ
jgi:SNF2 family DNA or RNA helicase